MSEQKRLFIVDTDPGIDDARSLLFLMNQPNVEIVAITTVAGNTYNAMTAFNAGVITQIAGKSNIPVYIGSTYNLNGTQLIKNCDLADIVSPADFHGSNGLGDIIFPGPGEPPKRDMKSWQALVYYARKYMSQITLVALGPLTNLALAFMHDHLVSYRFKRIFIMGSDRGEKTWSNASTFAEFNTYCDPIAANIVYKTFRAAERAPIFLLDWKFCYTHPLPENFYKNLAEELKKNKRDSDSKVFLSVGDPSNGWNNSLKIDIKGMVVADEFATLSAFDESLITDSELISITTCLEGQKYGHTSFCPSTSGNVCLIKEMDMQRFYKTFYAAFGAKYA